MRLLILMSVVGFFLTGCWSDREFKPMPRKPVFSKSDLSTDVRVACARFASKAGSKRFAEVEIIKNVFPEPKESSKEAWEKKEYAKVVPDQVMTLDQLYDLIGEPDKEKKLNGVKKQIYELGYDKGIIRQLWVYTRGERVLKHVYTGFSADGT